jgi:DNA-binding response OmpR family regulator
MRLLLVEDEQRVANFVARGLRAERYAVDIAPDGPTGWALASGMQHDLIIVDLMLPGLNGTELLSRYRSKGGRAPVLVLTARGSIDEKVQNFNAGADDYLTKPFAFAELLVRVKALLRRRPTNVNELLRVADLEIDRARHLVTRAGKRIELTTKEYALLEYLATNAGRVLSRTMIVDHVWDESFENVTNIVDVYVRYLRQKVDEPFAERLIHTIRGVGYSLAEEPKSQLSAPAEVPEVRGSRH